MKSSSAKNSTLAPIRQLRNNQSTRDYAATYDAIDRSQAVIEFLPDGTVLEANANFLGALGYRLDEIKGKHHQMFCDNEYTRTKEYADFWHRLANGEFFSASYRRVKKDGTPIWIQATYNPVFDKNGNVVRVIKFASDITELKLKQANDEGQLRAINRAMAVIEFQPDGTVITANKNFTDTLGYRLEDIKGRHHRMFCDPKYAASSDYVEFWQKLGRGEYIASEFKRFGAGGKPVYIIASYNPIFDADGKVT